MALLATLGEKMPDGSYRNLIIEISDDEKFGNNLSAYYSQTQEERKNKTPKKYIGNGRVIWYNGKEPKVISNLSKDEKEKNNNPEKSIVNNSKLEPSQMFVNTSDQGDLPF